MHTSLEVAVAIFAVVMVVCWLLGSVSSLTVNGFIHVLPIVAVSMMLPRIIYGRKTVEV
jgi:hypothetical protein